MGTVFSMAMKLHSNLTRWSTLMVKAILIMTLCRMEMSCWLCFLILLVDYLHWIQTPIGTGFLMVQNKCWDMIP